MSYVSIQSWFETPNFFIDHSIKHLKRALPKILPIDPIGPSKYLFAAFSIFIATDYRHPERAFFQKFETFGLGQTNWAEIL